MRNVWHICRREVGAYFLGPIPYVCLTVVLIFMGLIFTQECLGGSGNGGKSPQRLRNLHPSGSRLGAGAIRLCLSLGA